MACASEALSAPPLSNGPKLARRGDHWAARFSSASSGSDGCIQRLKQRMALAQSDGDGVGSSTGLTTPRFGRDGSRGWSQVARSAVAVVIDLVATDDVKEAQRIRTRNACAPAQQCMQGGPEVAAQRGQLVQMPRGMFGVRAAREDTVVDQRFQAFDEYRPGNVQMVTKVVKPPNAIERVADDQQRPALADELQRAGEGAVLCFVCMRHPHSLH